jgi:hypothetical protein
MSLSEAQALINTPQLTTFNEHIHFQHLYKFE